MQANMKYIRTLLVALAALSAGDVPAAQIACPTATTFDVLQALTAGGIGNACFSQDKLFWNFVYTPTGSAGSASTVQAGLLFQSGSGLDIHGWNFGSSSWVQGAAPAAFVLSYEMEVCPSGSACAGAVVPGTLIIAADAVYAPVSVFPAGNEVVTWSNGATVTLSNVTPGPLPSNGNIGLGAGTVGPITVTADWTGTGAITQTSLRFYENAVVPEPATLSMIGLGMLALGFRARKKHPQS